MVRARMARVALAAALGLACGCSTPCSSCPGTSLSSRLTGLFRRDRAPVEVIADPGAGPVVADPGFPEGPGCVPLPHSVAPPLFPPPGPLNGEAQRMPYQP